MKIPNNLLDAIKNKIIDLIKLKQRPFIASLIPDHLAFVQLMEHLFDEMQCRTAVLITKTLKNPFKHARTDPFRNEKRQIFIKSIKKNQMKLNKEIMLKDFAISSPNLM